MDIGWHIRRYLGWLNDDRCLVVRFEDLIGENGGGADERQNATLKGILGHLRIKKSGCENFELVTPAFHEHDKPAWLYTQCVSGDMIVLAFCNFSRKCQVLHNYGKMVLGCSSEISWNYSCLWGPESLPSS